MKPTTRLISLIAIAMAAPLAAQQGSVRDFQLPPAPEPSPSQQPQVQGPVDTEGVVPVGPRVIQTDSPPPDATTASEPQTAPPPTRQATQARPSQPQPARTAPVRTAPQNQPAPSTANSGGLPLILPESQQTSQPSSLPTMSAPSVASTASLPAPSIGGPQVGLASENEPASGMWSWLLAIIAVLGAAGAGWWFWRQRQPALASVPVIEPPLARCDAPPAPDPVATDRTSPAVTGTPSGLAITAAPVSLNRSMRFARFSYRLTFRNAGRTALENVAVGADLIAAHGSVPVEQQVASPAQLLPETGTIDSIAPGEQVEISGEAQLPLEHVRTIRQGQAHLYIPLLRVRAAAKGAEPVARTFVVGNLPGPDAKKLQPFRLDEMPQTYREIGVMALER